MNIVSSASRQIILDTETTGMNQSGGPVYIGHRIIEIGCVEVIDRKLTGRHFHEYINPGQEIDEEAIAVHGITNERVADCPRFHEIAPAFLDFIRGAEIVAHNAPFDISFMDHEFSLLNPKGPITADICSIVDSLDIAKHKHPGERNSLDALCKRYFVDNSRRELHGALLDAEILADVYLLMTGGQTKLNLSADSVGGDSGGIQRLAPDRQIGKVLMATADELTNHTERLGLVAKGGKCRWSD
ncbi:DNA polymerase III subunit epsilon [Parashewanella curva]|uniref:DNA polymerase III subunit epsilon n=1 Tax=Parashewanella curva TaxID=2338552 RepID=A0A3L8Q2F2_9GAMM|nr:DNA polymerase III subunit epsilon [Parashewanella curva]RLV61199.1 DNA polymerase III subunit epsilon [Parashewanella curva]